jgi:hypothetical protein
MKRNSDVQKLNWKHLVVNLQENYTANRSDELHRPSMTKLETMPELWDYIRKCQAEEFFGRAIRSDLAGRSIVLGK